MRIIVFLCIFTQEAKEQIKKSILLWLPDAKGLVEDDETEGATAKKVSDPLDCLPITAEAQLKAAKTLIEVEEYTVRSIVN